MKRVLKAAVQPAAPRDRNRELPLQTRSTASDRTRQRLIRAATVTLQAKGFAGCTSRAIAGAGKLNQALIFYHFGSVHELLLAALDQSSTRRLERYKKALADIESLQQLVPVMRELYEEDLAEGHVAVVRELVAGASSSPPLGRAIVARMDPWVSFGEETIAQLVSGTGLETTMPTRDLAFAITAFYLGIESVVHLNGDRGPVASVFATAAQVAPLADAFLRGSLTE